jgi:hypothetical protein
MRRPTLLAVLLLAAACSQPDNITGRTYSVETSFAKGDNLCAPAHAIEVDGFTWYGSTDPAGGLPPGHRYEGELYVVDQGPRKDQLVGTDPGAARFTTGSTTVTFTRRHACV